MDKKMHKITKKIEKAEHILEGAEKANEKLVKRDKNVIEPKLKACKKMKKK